MTVFIPNNTIVNQGLLYVTGLQLAITGNRAMTMQAGQARNTTNINDIVLSSVATLDAATVGANGLDTGTLAANTFYAVHVIGSSTFAASTAIMISLSATAPYLPLNYDMFLRVGYIRTDATPNILAGYWEGNSSERTFWYDTQIETLTAGTSATFAAVDLSLEVPYGHTTVMLDASFDANAAGDTFALRPTGSSSSDGMTILGASSGTAAPQQATTFAGVSSGDASIDYKVAASGSLVLSVVGYVDHLLG